MNVSLEQINKPTPINPKFQAAVELVEELKIKRELPLSPEVLEKLNSKYKTTGIKYNQNGEVVKIRYNAEQLLNKYKQHTDASSPPENYSFYISHTSTDKPLLIPKPKRPKGEAKSGAFGTVKQGGTLNITRAQIDGASGGRDSSYSSQLIIANEQNAQPVAIKKFKIDELVKMRGQKAILDLLGEAKNLKKVDQYITHFRIGNNFYIVTKLVPGKSIDKKDSAKYSLSDKLKIALSITQDLMEVHTKGILHRDLKGANVLVNPSSLAAKIIDFGEAIDLEDPSKKIEPAKIGLAGTPGYIAPELLKALFNPETQKSIKECFSIDIYSLGKCLMYDLELYNLAIVYRMIDPDYRKRPTLTEVLDAINSYQKNLESIIAKETAIGRIEHETSLSQKIDAIQDLYVKHGICSEHYFDTLTIVLQQGTPEQLQKMMTIPMFHNLCIPTANPGGGIVTNKFENQIKYFFELCKVNNSNGRELAAILLTYINDLRKSEQLSSDFVDHKARECISVFSRKEDVFLQKVLRSMEELDKLSTEWQKLQDSSNGNHDLQVEEFKDDDFNANKDKKEDDNDDGITYSASTISKDNTEKSSSTTTLGYEEREDQEKITTTLSSSKKLQGEKVEKEDRKGGGKKSTRKGM